MILADQEARRRIREDLDSTLIVEAAAGTGKTTELVARIVALVREGRAPLSKILAVTFTDKAAGEMKLRLRTELEKAREAALDAVRRDRLTAALAELEVAQVGTIHSVCADLLRERPIEAGVDPLFEVAAADVAERLYDGAFEAWLQQTLQSSAMPEGVRRLLRRRPRGRDAPGPRENLRSAGWDLCEHRDFEAAYRRDPWDRPAAIAAVALALEELGALGPRAQKPDDWLAKSILELHLFATDLKHRLPVGTGDARDRDDGLEAELHRLLQFPLIKIWNWRGRGKWFADGVEREKVVQQRDALKAKLEAFFAAADADLAACLREELRPVVAGYEERKARAGCLDFLDLLACARDLVNGDAAVRAELRERYSHVLVDEFQDTDPLQAELLLAIAGEAPGRLFVVGDPKQSIYRFRRADLALYEDVKQDLVSRGADVLFLTTSFRGAPGIQAAVNAAFAPAMQGEPGQARYVALDQFRADVPSQPAVIALPAPKLYGTKSGKVEKGVLADSYADAAGAFVHWLVGKSGWTVSERDGQGRVPVEARHVCLLFKRLQSFGLDVTRPYVKALEARGVPHVLVGGKSYHAREEVLAIRNAAQAIEWPDDELAVFAALRGPLFALGDDALLAFRGELGRLHPLRAFDFASFEANAAEDRPEKKLVKSVAEALQILGRLHRARNFRPIAETLSRLLEATRAHAGLAIWPSGEQALANVLRVLDLARRFESAGASSFRGFVDRLAAEEERGDAAEAPAVEEGSEGVRIMSVHRAKGLEFPVVILCDPTGPAAPKNPSRHVDPARKLWAMPLAGCAPIELVERRDEVLARDRAEAIRLAYVAATRARDLLVAPLIADEPPESWLSPLQPVLEPRPDQRSKAEAAPGCPAFTSRDVVLDRPEMADRFASSLSPGLHAPREGTHQLVVWDPRALDLEREPEGGLRREALLEQDTGGSAEAGLKAHEEWKARRAGALAAGGVPTLRLVTATALAIQADPVIVARPVAQAAVEDRGAHRPHGKRFGTLVHAVLALADLGAGAASLRKLAEAQGRLLGASAPEVEAAVLAAAAALRHPLLVRAALSADCRREAPLFLTLPDGSIAEGVADLAFRELTDGAARWTVVDFKTDARPHLKAGHLVQLSLYAEAITRATGEPADAVLLAV